MNLNLSHPFRLLLFAIVLPFLFAGMAHAQDESDDDVFTLSPFSVDGSENTGYRATSTLAGTRLKTEIKDIATAISVYTEEFLEDTAATNAEELLVYSAGTEVPGIAGNFANVSAGGAATINDDNSRRRPQDNTRVRGLAAADLSRDYFASSIPFDTYNTNAITINRGSNSILFGLGSPAGIINNGLKQAYFGELNELKLRVDSFGSTRASIDLNRTLIDDQLAIRITALKENRKYEIEPAFERDDRVFGTLTFKPFKENSNTTIRAHFESGSINANRPRLSPPVDAVSAWWDPSFNNGAPYPDRLGSNGRPFIDPANEGYAVILPDGTNVTPAFFYNIGAALWTPAVVFDGPNASLANPAISNEPFVTPDRTVPREGVPSYQNSAGDTVRQPSFATLRASALAMRVAGVPFNGFYQNKQITDSSIFDFNNVLLDGPNKSEWARLSGYNIAIEQLFLNKKAGIELAFDNQSFDDGWVADIDGGRGRFITVDTNVTLQNGQENPNFGRPFVTGIGSAAERYTEREAMRLQAFYELDFNDVFSESKLGQVLGKHTFTGLYNQQSADTLNANFRRAAWGDERGDFVLANRFGGLSSIYNGNRAVGTQIYLGDSFANEASPAGWNIQGPTVPYQIRDTETVTLFNERTQQFEVQNLSTIQYENERERLASGGNLNRVDVDSSAAVLQSRWFDNMFVTTVGYREDEATIFENPSPPRSPNGNAAILDPAQFFLPSSPSAPPLKTNVWSYGVVGHVPSGWLENMPAVDGISIHYSESENFIPSPGRVNIAGEVLPPEGGSTDERGVSMELMDGKVFFKANWYETSQSNITEPNFGDVEDLFEWEARIIERAPGIIASEADLRQLPLYANAQPFSNLRNYVDPNTLAPIGYSQDFLDFLGANPVDADGDGFPDEGSIVGNLNLPSGLAATSNIVSTGFEFESVINPVTGWSIMFNAVQQEVVRSGSGPALQALVAERLPIIEQFGDLPQDVRGDETVIGRINRTVIVPIKSVLAQNDSPLVTEIREWRWNLATNYVFSEGGFKGFGVGGGARWQDDVAIGYAVKNDPELGETLDTDISFSSGKELNLDLWLSYKRPVFGEKVDWKVQLNVRNLDGDDDLIATVANPNGEIAGWRIKEPRSFVLTNTFKF